MKPVTQPIDKRGGHPTILQELRKGNAVYCNVWDDDPDQKYERWIVAYYPNGTHRYAPYYTKDATTYRHAYPIPAPQTKTQVKSADKIMAILLEQGYEPDEHGHWQCKNMNTFASGMWFYCGKTPSSIWSWAPEWLEEVEI